MSAKTTPSLLGAIAAALTFFGGLHLAAPAAPALGAPESTGTGAAAPSAGSCADECNRKASDCLDGCEERFKDDDKARVTCKFECANKRQQCEKGCE